MSYNTSNDQTMYWRWNVNPGPGSDPSQNSESYTKTTYNKHPKSWNSYSHYGQCGQSCPCCRAKLGESWGACTICNK